MKLIYILGVFTASVSMLMAEVTVPSIFSDNAVLQAMKNNPVWGWAAPDEVVKVSWGTVQGEVKTGADGKWRVHLNLEEADTKPQDLVIQGTNKIVAKNVVVGEVWLCSGQSNMEWPLRGTIDSWTEIANSSNPMIREFYVPHKAASQPQEKGEGSWTVSGPTTSAKYSAAGYYFAKKINKELKRPVGIIHSSWGGTPIEAWTSDEGFQKNTLWNEGKEKLSKRVDAFQENRKEFTRLLSEWTQKTGRADKRSGNVDSFAAVELADLDTWTKVPVPGRIAGKEIPSQGVVWVRIQFDLPPEFEGQAKLFNYGPINNFEEVYVNGKKIFETTIQSYISKGMPRQCQIPALLLKGGKNVIAIRIYAPINIPEIPFHFPPINIDKIVISGVWLAKAEDSFSDVNPQDPLVPKMVEGIPEANQRPTYLYNAMIHPWITYGMKGVNWYQGEGNTFWAAQYQTILPLMIQNWRDLWKQGDFHFNICQISSYFGKDAAPQESTWAELRDAQTQALSVPNTGVANLIDLGEASNIHPGNKKDVGERLAMIALAKCYGQKISYSGPLYVSMSIEGSSIRIQFKHTDGGLVAKPLPEFYEIFTYGAGKRDPLKKLIEGSPLQGFAICGVDKKWVWANAVIDGETVLVSSAKVPQPIAVRYAWANNPTCNLYNGADLPAFPFRTDQFPRLTEGKNNP